MAGLDGIQCEIDPTKGQFDIAEMRRIDRINHHQTVGPVVAEEDRNRA